jgi:DNA modification methylase
MPRRPDAPTAPTHVKHLVPDPQNRRKHNPRNLGMVVDALQQVGAARSIVIDEDNVILAGNGVTEAAAEAGITKVRVIDAAGDELIAVRRSGLTAEQKRALAIFDNRTGELAEWNAEQLQADADAGLDLKPFFSDEELAAILASEATQVAGQTDPDDVPAVRATDITPGDLFQLGRHRLLCGDSTSVGAIEKLMCGEKAALIATDPPYGVAYGVETGTKGTYRPIANDDNDGPKLQAFLEEVFRTALPFLRDDAAWYLWHAQLTQGFFAAAAAAAAAAVRIHRQIIWVKPSLVLGHGDYHWQHELCFYGWREGNRARWFGDRSQTTVWEVGRENDKVHPTQKPVELFARPMRFNTIQGEVCFEPFSGSGSQLLAAEQQGRRCCAVELDPQYVQVAIDRWEAFTGQKAVKVGEVSTGNNGPATP